jgi:hypothetical protein
MCGYRDVVPNLKAERSDDLERGIVETFLVVKAIQLRNNIGSSDD